MSQTIRTGVAAIAMETLVLDVVAEGDACVVRAAGELDVESRFRLLLAATEGTHPSMVIDVSAVTFMDCGGYGCLVAARLVLESGGRTLTIRGHAGQPKRLIDLIAASESRCGAVETS